MISQHLRWAKMAGAILAACVVESASAEYMARLQRFAQRDPIVHPESTTGAYRYARECPLAVQDPSGEWSPPLYPIRVIASAELSADASQVSGGPNTGTCGFREERDGLYPPDTPGGQPPPRPGVRIRPVVNDTRQCTDGTLDKRCKERYGEGYMAVCQPGLGGYPGTHMSYTCAKCKGSCPNSPPQKWA